MLNLLRIKFTVIVQFYLIGVYFGLCSALYLNDECVINQTGENGTCKFVNDCPRVIIEAQEQSKYPTLCGFERAKQIICCPYVIVPNRINTQQESKSSRISAEKCLEYQRTCSSNSVPFNSAVGDAEPREFPYNAAFGFVDSTDSSIGSNDGSEVSGKIEWVCGGSVISEYFVLTVAHCIRRTLKYVRLGDLDVESEEDDIGARQFNVIEIFRHPHYKYSQKYEDIGLLRVDGPIEFNDYIRPACLPDINTIISDHLFVAGRGHDYNRTNQLHLQKIQLKLVSHAECNEYYSSRIYSGTINKGIVNRTQICAGSDPGESDTCAGYSGYALINTDHKHSCLHDIVGLTSFSAACSIGAPGVFTRVSAYLDWIEDIVWLNGNGSTITIKPDEEPIIQIPSTNRTSSKKCQEYKNILSQSLSNSGYFSLQNNQNVSECPLIVRSYIVDGEDAVSAKEFPHMALIGFVRSNNGIWWGCGGSLISEYFVLTAAHCLYKKSLGNATYVLLGDLDYDDDEDDADPQRFNVAERIKHPDFVKKFKYNDIGLLRLASAVSFSQYIRPICLPDTSSIAFTAVATGWGKLAQNLPTTSHLQKVELDLYTHEECNGVYEILNSITINKGIINNTQICAGSHGSSHADTCQGDSGGPLQISHNKYSCMSTVVGITSFGALCGSRVPSIYTRVFSYVDWIEGIVWPNLTTVHRN